MEEDVKYKTKESASLDKSNPELTSDKKKLAGQIKHTLHTQPQLASASQSELQQHVIADAVAVERRPSPSDAPQGDWPCVVIGSGFTTQQRSRSLATGVLGSRPFCHKRRERRPCHDIFVAQPLSNPTHMRVKAPKGNHYACRTAEKNGSRATKDVAARQRSHAMAQPAPKAKPAARGAPPSPPTRGEVGGWGVPPPSPEVWGRRPAPPKGNYIRLDLI